MWRYVGSRASIEGDAPPAVRGGLAAPADKQSPLPWRRVAGQAALIWLATRAAYAAFTLFAVTFSSGSRQLGVVTVTPTALLHAWQHWDAHWYLRIAALGYYNIHPAAFCPLYPALIHVGSLVVGANHALAVAMLIGNLGTLGAFIAVALLAVHETGDDEGAWRTLRLLIAFPLAFFLFAPYTAGIFLGLAAATLLCIRRGSWRWAALWAFLAGLTRPTSVALVLPMAWEYGRQHGWWTRAWWHGAGYRALQGWRALAEVAAVVGAVPAAFTLYALYCWAQLGHPLALLNSQREYWGHRTVFPGQAILIAAQRILAAPFPSDLQTSLLVNFVPLVAFIVI